MDEEPEIQFFAYHVRWKPVPDGWEIVDMFEGCHHEEFAVLIRKCDHCDDCDSQQQA
jgi:hypothetical protein